MKISVCSLEDSANVEQWLKHWLNLSGQKLKHHCSKKLLEKKLTAKEEIDLPLNLVNHGEIFPVYTGKYKPVILTEDENFLVIEKPIQCHNHPLSYEEGDNLLSFLREKNYHKVLWVNRDSYDRGLLYRLDFETSGLMIVAKNSEAYFEIRKNFKNIMKKKIYHCEVSGDFQFSGTIKNTMSAFGPDAKKMRVVDEEKSEKAELAELEVVKLSFNTSTNRSLLEVSLKTGLRHQIRVQLAHLGYPLMGDELYGGESSSRLHLHAYQYQFQYGGKELLFQTSPPIFPAS